MFVVPDQRPSIFDRGLNVFAFELDAILIAQDGEQQLIFHGRFERVPVDVEVLGITRSTAIFEHVLPPD